jgi:cyclic pyranopterin phosphate synthase
MRDELGRRIDYLRLSVTDRCNLRCVYCVGSSAEPAAAPAREPLSDVELLRLAGCLVGLGVTKVRVTGGEPLVRPDLEGIVAGLADLPGVTDLSLTTNGMLLASRAQALRRAGLQRINISLDTLRPEQFRAMAGARGLERVRRGISAALDAGLDPVKLNVVVVRGMNDEDIPQFVHLAHATPVHVRFIELMPLGEARYFSSERWVPWEEMRRRCGVLLPVPETQKPVGAGPAVYFRSPGGRGTVGFIAALSRRFCSDCNRLRLTAAGRLLPCLARQEDGIDLAGLLRRGASLRSLREAVLLVLSRKAAGHDMRLDDNPACGQMCSVGG